MHEKVEAQEFLSRVHLNIEEDLGCACATCAIVLGTTLNLAVVSCLIVEEHGFMNLQ